MDVQLVIGAGAIGTATAQLLADRGERVRLVTRGGGGPEHLAIERVAADASDADALSRLAEGVAVIYSCAGPAYPRWVTDWPPLAAALLRAAETSGALLVTTGNLYGYGAVDGPMTEGLPLRPNTEKGQVRVRLWNDALEAHRAGRIRTAEVRGSDYLGAAAVTPLTLLVLPKVLAGKRAWAPPDLDAPHSWTYTGDVARTLLAVAADAGSWGRAWHVPTGPPKSFPRGGDPGRRAGRRTGSTAVRDALRAAVARRPVQPDGPRGAETQYQFRKSFVLDSTAATEAFGISPTPLDDALHETIADLRSRS
jgi:nucleoside-diphosphate-sugar epimerase